MTADRDEAIIDLSLRGQTLLDPRTDTNIGCTALYWTTALDIAFC
jgi:hypothetical protein